MSNFASFNLDLANDFNVLLIVILNPKDENTEFPKSIIKVKNLNSSLRKTTKKNKTES
jgi:hypothetical protein